jgi:hypothetical protein
LYQWEHNELIKIKLRKRILLCSLKSHIILSLELPQDIEQILQLDMGINKSVGYKNLYALFNQDKKKIITVYLSILNAAAAKYMEKMFI